MSSTLFLCTPALESHGKTLKPKRFNYLKYSYRMRQKELYEAPETEVLELRLEGVIATSGEGMGWGLEGPEPDPEG